MLVALGVSDDKNHSVEARTLIQQIRRQFVESLPNLLEELSQACRLAAPGGGAACTVARELAHRLAGSAGTFGMPWLTEECRKLETVLAAPVANEAWRRRLRRAEVDIAAAAGRLPVSDPPPSRHGKGAGLVAIGTGSGGHRLSTYPSPMSRWAERPIAILIEDPAVRAALDSTLIQFGFHTIVVSDTQQLCLTPLAWLCDLSHAASVRADFAQADLVVVLPEVALETRLAAVRVGAKATVPFDVDAPELAAAMERLVPLDMDVPCVLIVDDDELVARRTAIILQSAGLDAVVLIDPTNLLEVVAESRPHLVLMDMHLPKCTGLELAAVLRQDDRMVGVPIVFFTAENAPRRALQALEVGADDFLIKPVSSERLVSVVMSRLHRSRALRSFMDRDGLTRLLSHAPTLQRLEAEVASAQRRQEPLSLVILDLDHFKRVNDRFGHAAGDRVLRSLATVLRRRSRRGDVVGRCGGEEFVLVLPGSSGEQSLRLVDALRSTFAELSCASPSGPVKSTFSAGVAQLCPGESSEKLWDRADSALYKAKSAGRNRVVVAHPGCGDASE